jgi:hypothetical protein
MKLAEAMMTRTLMIQRSERVKFTHFRCTSEELFFSCFDSVAAPRQLPGRQAQLPARRCGNRMDAAIKYLRCITSAAARSGLGRLNPEVVNIFGVAARYRRARVGSSHDDAHLDNSALNTGKIYFF